MSKLDLLQQLEKLIQGFEESAESDKKRTKRERWTLFTAVLTLIAALVAAIPVVVSFLRWLL